MAMRRWSIIWDFIKCLWEIISHTTYGVWRLSRVPEPVITVFGGARFAKDNPYAIHAQELGSKIAREGFSIITGGGPGIMEAANMGAYTMSQQCLLPNHTYDKSCQKKVFSIGIGLIRLNADKPNPYVQENITMDHFFTRKWLLVRYSVGFVIFPGGFGTFDEFFEIITLQQTGHMQKSPIILFGKNYWQPLLNWLENYPLKQGLIAQKDFDLIKVVDDVDEAIKIIRTDCGC